jgi:tRNA G26 N,N-dimethylase Trm1
MDQDGGVKPRLQDKRQQTGGGLRILDALSASGLRAIRFAREVPNVDSVLANDFSEQAFETIKRNVQRNQLEAQVKPVYSDAMYQNGKGMLI